MSNVGVVVLAAGESRRMGRPKQLLPFRGTTLLGHAVRTALTTAFRPVVVVLGAASDVCRAELEALPITLVLNSKWKDGMGTSIQAGIEALESAEPTVEGVLIMLHDQPLISAHHLEQLVREWKPPGQIVASAYGEDFGVPALFAKALFPELKRLAGPGGAKKIIASHRSTTARVPLPVALVDIDTPADYERLRSNPLAGSQG